MHSLSLYLMRLERINVLRHDTKLKWDSDLSSAFDL